ncbi:hypothetical protein [Streptomyces coeruleorubidus]|uniref:hypothetical protein n=1 Tax=Streptomyces coeruleorubidus TaxID=116188 RepID=UPI0036A72025
MPSAPAGRRRVERAAVQALFDSAHLYGSQMCLTLVEVPAYWDGSVFTRGPDVAAPLEAQAHRGRPLGQLPLPGARAG